MIEGEMTAIAPVLVLSWVVWLMTIAAALLLVRYVTRAHEQELARMDAMYTATLAKLTNAQTFGTPVLSSGEVEEREPEPETRAARQIDKEVLDRGVNALRREYLSAGVQVADADLEDEVRVIMRGETPRVRPELAPFIRD